MALRNDRPCPYEVMRRGNWRPGRGQAVRNPNHAAAGTPAAGQSANPGDPPGGASGPHQPASESVNTFRNEGYGADTGTAAPRGFLAKAGHPMVLRLPRGYAVVLVLGIFIIFVLAYMAGYVRGERHGAEEMRQRYSELLQSAAHHDDPFATPHVLDPGGPEDPRIGGYYYFRLIANHSEEVARSLVAFTRARGVETFATVSNNDRFNVWAAQPFVRDDRTRGDRDSFRETLHSLGRQWRTEQQQPEDLFNASLIQYRPR